MSEWVGGMCFVMVVAVCDHLILAGHDLAAGELDKRLPCLGDCGISSEKRPKASHVHFCSVDVITKLSRN